MNISKKKQKKNHLASNDQSPIIITMRKYTPAIHIESNKIKCTNKSTGIYIASPEYEPNHRNHRAKQKNNASIYHARAGA